MSIEGIVKSTMEERQMTYRMMAQALSERLGLTMSHVTILNWAAGKTVPQTDVLLRVKQAYPGDWRGLFAEQVLQEKLGDVFEKTA